MTPAAARRRSLQRPTPDAVGIILRRPRLLAFLAGAAAATGFAPLFLWPVTLAAFALLMALMERNSSPNSLPSFPRRRESRMEGTALQNSGSRIKSGMTNGGKDAFLLGWCFGVGHFTLGNNWIAHAFTFQDKMPHWFGYGAVFLLSLYLAVYPGLATLAVHRIRLRWPALAATPVFAAAWIVTEYGRASIFTGFSWNPLGVIWLDTGIDQAARFIGTYGLGALAIIAAGSLLALVRRHWLSLAPLAALLGIAVWGHRLPPIQQSNIPITVVQPNINQNEKYDPALEQRNYAKLAQLTGPSSPARPRIVFWPESAVPAWLDMEPGWRLRLAELLGPNDLLSLGGAKVYFREQDKGFYQDRTLIGANNSAWVLTPDARLIARYDKAHLVPYGEYLPLRDILQPLGLSRLVPGDTDFWPGPGPRSLTLPAAPGRPPLKMGAQICYEIIFSGEVIDRADRPDFLFNPSNDAWFGSWGPPQHLAQARLRAIEEAMPVIRSTPTGISAVVDAQGRVIGRIPHHQADAINTLLPPAAPPTLFSRLGNLLPAAFAFLLVAFAVVSGRVRR